MVKHGCLEGQFRLRKGSRAVKFASIKGQRSSHRCPRLVSVCHNFGASITVEHCPFVGGVVSLYEDDKNAWQQQEAAGFFCPLRTNDGFRLITSFTRPKKCSTNLVMAGGTSPVFHQYSLLQKPKNRYTWKCGGGQTTALFSTSSALFGWDMHKKIAFLGAPCCGGAVVALGVTTSVRVVPPELLGHNED